MSTCEAETGGPTREELNKVRTANLAYFREPRKDVNCKDSLIARLFKRLCYGKNV